MTAITANRINLQDINRGLPVLARFCAYLGAIAATLRMYCMAPQAIQTQACCISSHPVRLPGQEAARLPGLPAALHWA